VQLAIWIEYVRQSEQVVLVGTAPVMEYQHPARRPCGSSLAVAERAHRREIIAWATVARLGASY
jgi:hypothetical protein